MRLAAGVAVLPSLAVGGTPAHVEWQSVPGKLTSLVISDVQDWADASLLVPHEGIRVEMEALSETLPYLEDGEPWKLDLFLHWYKTYFYPLVKGHHDHEDRIFFPWLKERAHLPMTVERDHEELLELMDRILHFDRSAYEAGERRQPEGAEFSAPISEEVGEDFVGRGEAVEEGETEAGNAQGRETGGRKGGISFLRGGGILEPSGGRGGSLEFSEGLDFVGLEEVAEADDCSSGWWREWVGGVAATLAWWVPSGFLQNGLFILSSGFHEGQQEEGEGVSPLSPGRVGGGETEEDEVRWGGDAVVPCQSADPCVSWSVESGKELRRLAESLVESVTAHLAEEEKVVPPLLRAHATEKETNETIKRIQFSMGITGARLELPPIYEASKRWMAKDTFDFFWKQLPLLVRFALFRFWLPEWEKGNRGMLKQIASGEPPLRSGSSGGGWMRWFG
uniref:Hemerythrin-like domain-containing protein n=2 Tax=Chromera velia CCMP2878 TaxID=1169474 RepID=A0A0G4GXD0_9ALVE|eukprot:Cvel_23791.t1-p1 / transcript=Cvel_23791.t1 / gene=Cvel_23791 / organism=Chromera_velia_CCMP2878 / gene_product=hypothetical protein / transcript_product=hypothetical protein / location=Cvel_scaffold2497:4-3357(-) / protein_length=449 / sequence_SO=supercontig / SO=protein_coding / is_pseudo=false